MTSEDLAESVLAVGQLTLSMQKSGRRKPGSERKMI
jgi:hypothetical protein